jgi:hypothetical protein
MGVFNIKNLLHDRLAKLLKTETLVICLYQIVL